MRSTTTYFAKDGRVYAKTPDGTIEAGTALSANARDLERFERALDQARSQREASPRKGYFISTPYIDAYQHSYGFETPEIDYAGFVLRMENQAYSWGEQSVGRRFIAGKDPARHGGQFVLAFGAHGDEHYIAVSSTDGTIKVIEVNKDEIDDEWDVT